MEPTITIANRKEWPCVNAEGKVDSARPCHTNLGTIINGELVIELANVQAVNTNGVDVVLTCANCGRPKTWYAKDAAIARAYQISLARETAKQQTRMSLN